MGSEMCIRDRDGNVKYKNTQIGGQIIRSVVQETENMRNKQPLNDVSKKTVRTK